MTLPIGTFSDSGKLKSPLVPEKEKNHVREGNLDVPEPLVQFILRSAGHDTGQYFRPWPSLFSLSVSIR